MRPDVTNVRVAIFNDTRGDHRHFGCALVMDRLEALIGAAGGEVVFSWPCDRDWRTAVHELPERPEIDVIVVNGEGTMHGAPGRKNAVALAEIAAFAKQHYGVPVALVNATIYNNDATFYESLKHFDLIWLRDRMSCESAAKHEIVAQYCPDLTLSSDWSETSSPRQNIGVTGSVRHRDDRSLREFARATGSEFVSMVENEQPSLASHLTLSLGRHRKAWRARQRFHEIDWDKQPQSPAALISWISGKSLIVTGRYHTVTLCVLTRTPVLFLESNTPKITALCQDVGLRSDRLIKQLDPPSSAQVADLIALSDFDSDESKSITDFAEKSKTRFHDLELSLAKLFAATQSSGSAP
jgi:hypothetical protein